MWRDPDDLEIGINISDVPQVKIIFDGYGYDEETNEENADKNSESYAIFIHRDSASDMSWEFPEHDFTPWAMIHRQAEEVCIYAWYMVDEDRWHIPSLEETDCRDHTYASIMKILEQINEWYFPHRDEEPDEELSAGGSAAWPFSNTKK